MACQQIGELERMKLLKYSGYTYSGFHIQLRQSVTINNYIVF